MAKQVTYHRAQIVKVQSDRSHLTLVGNKMSCQKSGITAVRQENYFDLHVILDGKVIYNTKIDSENPPPFSLIEDYCNKFNEGNPISEVVIARSEIITYNYKVLIEV